MNNIKFLSIKGAVLDKNQLENYLEKVASDHVLKKYSDKNTYPVLRLKENFKFITKTYNFLNKNIKDGVNIHPAGEWLLDNYYIIEESVKAIEKDLTEEKYRNLLGIQGGIYDGYSRIYVLANEIIAYTDGKIDSNNLEIFLQAYQRKKTLNMEEIWNVGLFLQIAIIENIRQVCEKILSSQIQKYKVENIVERLVENKEKSSFKLNQDDSIQNLSFVDMKYPFIEYMAYRLKRLGRKAISYMNVLEEEVKKMGTTVSEVIKKEHFDIAVKKVSIGNGIKSIKRLQRINFLEIFEHINGVEDILRNDPANVYTEMEYKSKNYYRNKIKEISKKTKISEIYIASKALELANLSFLEKDNIYKEKKSHIGYYLIDNGEQELMKLLLYEKEKIPTNSKVDLYIFSTWGVSAILATLIGIYIYYSIQNILLAILIGLFFYIPISELVIKIVNTILGKTVKPKLIPKLDFSDGIPNQFSTMVVVPTIIDSQEKVKKLIKKLEVYYIANKSENIYFTLLGDCSSSDKKIEEIDTEIINIGIEEIKRLNDKYPDEKFPKFNFLYRHRNWSDSEGCYLGWERKRGLLTQFSNYLLEKEKDIFRANTIEMWKLSNDYNKNIPKIKYVITLDADTELVLNSGLELIGAMAHILNKPIIDKNKNIVIDGYGIMQPRVGIDLESANKSIFTRIFAGLPGTDLYTNAISDLYQDNFGEGIFTGKGIYDLDVFNQILYNRIPENKVLSHDLLEGNYLRCGLVSDIMLLDGYPSKYNSNMKRLHRWIRGDWQITDWLKKNVKESQGYVRTNPLNKLSKYKILDNLRRSLVEVFLILDILILLIISYFYKSNPSGLIVVVLLTIFIPTIIDIILKKEDVSKQRYFTPVVTGIKWSFIAGIINLACLPNKAYVSFNAIIKALYRDKISHKKLLEWTTSEQAEKNSKNSISSYLKDMFFNIIFGILAIIAALYFNNVILEMLLIILGVLWLTGPFIAYYISKPIEYKKIELTDEENRYIIDLGRKTWNYFEKYMNEENNYLPPDNYQEDRAELIVNRTSSTNIGLGLLAVVSAFDLGYINLKDSLYLIEKTMETVKKLPKWNGHLYNWYNIKTLKPLYPRYISTVDSGNFVGYLYTLKQFIKSVIKNKTEKDLFENLEEMLKDIDTIIDNTDFSVLYDEEKGIFSIGFNVEENTITDSYYDLLASEARQASIVAIAKKDIPAKHWNNLSRTLTSLNGYKGLISWSGTAFEYLMPNINIRKYRGSLLDESCKFLIMSQREYSKRLDVPWGISEAAFNLKDLNSNYQYKAFGIPWLGLKRGLADELNISPYASILAITEESREVIKNLKDLESKGMYNKYGFYEALDFTPDRLPYGEKYIPVKTYMAHHQGLILLSINNLMNNNVLQNRFMKNPEIQAIDVLLQERMPTNVVITKEKKEKVEKLRLKDYEQYSERIITRLNRSLNNSNVFSSNDYLVCTKENGEGYSQYKNILINRFKETDDYSQGIFFYLKNIRNKKIWTSKDIDKADKYSIHFTPDSSKFIRSDENIETTVKIVISPDEPVEIRRIELKNNGSIDETIEISSVFEPVISNKEQEFAHPAFNNLFLKYEYLDESNSILIKRNKRGNVDEIFLGVNLYTENETIGELEYEIDKQKLFGRGNLGIPNMIEKSIPFSKKIGNITNPIVALRRTIRIKPGEKISLNLLITVSHNKDVVKSNLEKYRNEENILRTFELSKAKVEEENRYLGIKGKEIEKFQKILSYLIFQNPTKKLYANKINNKKGYSQVDLWKYGISGDIPIMLLRIKDINDVDVLKDLLKAYEYFKIKNIKIDFVILNEEENIYEKYLEQAIEAEINNRQLNYLKNISGGIFIINTADIEDENIFIFRANLVIDAHDGNIENIIQNIEEDYIKSIRVISNDNSKIINNLKNDKMSIHFDSDNLKYYNEYGGFSNDGKEYIIRINKENKLPTVWSHVLSNPNFGTVVTENMGGYTWNQNSRLNRLTSWTNNPVTDIPSEIIYLKDMDNSKVWSLGFNPIPDENDYIITYGFGYARYNHNSDGIIQETEVFVPREDRAKINIIRLKNIDSYKKKIKLLYYIKPVLGEDELRTIGFIDMKFDEENNNIKLKNVYTNDFVEENMYVTSSEKIQSYTGNKQFFMGEGGVTNPDGINKVRLDNDTNTVGQTACVAIEILIELNEFESKEISLVIGEENSEDRVNSISKKYADVSECKKELSNTKRFWYEMINTIQVDTPVGSMNIMLNGWTQYQTIACRLWARTGFYQSGGAYGFRDQLQDTLGLKYIDINFMKNQILKHAAHQFVEGDVEHWWHDETQKGIRTKFSDDLLWLVYLTCEYIIMTGDYSILDEEIPYITGNILDENTDENYDIHPISQIKENLYMHCLRAIEKGINLGEHGIPKIGSGDWNDAFSTVGNKGRGESVWLGFFIYDILNKFVSICKEKGDNDLAYKYENINRELKRNINEKCWDGRWFRRAFTDDGTWIGSAENEEGRIDNIAQSWSVISGGGDNDKKYISMDYLDKNLVDRENEIIKLLTPAFEKSDIEPGYIKAYLPGVRENGGQYTHGAIWSVWANCILGFNDRAMEYFNFINPIEHSRTKDAIRKYNVEPYVIAADMYGVSNLAGRGGWTWYTGSSSWFIKIGIEGILGFSIENGYIKLKPSIPTEWKEYKIIYRYKNSVYIIKVKNNTMVKNVFSNNNKKVKEIKLENNGKINEIEVEI